MQLLAKYGCLSPTALDGERLLLQPRNDNEYESLWDSLSALADYCSRTEIRAIVIRFNKREQIIRVADIMNIKKLRIAPELSFHEALYSMGLAVEKGEILSLVRMKDHKGLLSVGSERSAGVRGNDWVGQSMDRYWPDQELQRFTAALETHQSLNGFEYWALRMSDMEPVNLVVDAQIVTYQGDPCRLVKTLSSCLRC